MMSPKRTIDDIVDELLSGVAQRGVLTACVMFVRTDGEAVIGWVNLDNNVAHLAHLKPYLERLAQRCAREEAASLRRRQLLN